MPDKHWPNTWTEVEDLGNGKFAASITVGHRVFFDKVDGNKPKKHKLTDNRPNYVLVQSAKCCIEIHPFYAVYYDVQHEEVRVEEERWVVQRLFKEPDTWRDVDAYNPVITVEEWDEPAGYVIKVTNTYDTDYGILTVEYLQRDGNPLKHSVTFKNNSGSTETFRVLQKWSGIVASKFSIKGQRLSFTDDLYQSRIIEDFGGIVRNELTDFAKMLTGSREPNQGTVFDRDGIRFLVENSITHLFIDGIEAMITDVDEMSIMVKAVEKCPSNARVFIGGLGPGFILYILANSYKTQEIIVVEKDQRIIDEFAPILSQWFSSHYPQINLQILHGDAKEEVSQHGLFDWIFMDFFFKVGESTPEIQNELRDISTPNLTISGVYTSYADEELRQGSGSMRLKPIEVVPGASGLKTDFTYESWVLLQEEELIIDPDTATLDNPTEDGYMWRQGTTVGACTTGDLTRSNTEITFAFGGKQVARSDIRAYRGYVEWLVDVLAGNTLTANPIFKFHGSVTYETDGEINPLTEEAPLGATDANLWDYIISGAAYVVPFTFAAAPNQSQDLGASAKADLQAAMDASQSWWAIGLASPDDECPDGLNVAGWLYSEDWASANPKPTLYVEYEAAAPAGQPYISRVQGVQGMRSWGGI